MSGFLYRLGRRLARRPGRVLAAGLLLVAVLGGSALAFGGQLKDEFTIPGTEAQAGLDVLRTRFPEVAGANGQLLYTAPRGSSIRGYRTEIERRIAAVKQVDHVLLATDPFAQENAGLAISQDGRRALVQIQLDRPAEQLDPRGVERIAQVAARPVSPAAARGLDTSAGGQMYAPRPVTPSVVEAVGLAVALGVLLLTLGSLVAAGIPILTALLGVGATLAGIVTIASLVTVNTSTPSLAMMIGLAVGIDYALLLAARHRDQLRDGLAVQESVARALATAGSAVIFAGLTVIIALCGLAVARIPFLTVMGVAGAVAVAVSVLVALTLVPAALTLAGERLRPKRPRRAGAHPVAFRWVALVTRRPVLTVLAVVSLLVLLALPAKDMNLALPDTGSAEQGTSERTTYDAIDRAYGPGYNNPLLLTADIIRTREPVAVMRRIGRYVGRLSGVDTVALTTPNRSADLGIVQIVPEYAQTDPRAADLVRALRKREPMIEQRYGVTDVRVTGQTAAAIDVSQRLGGALLPFGLVVVGLSLVLLTLVFRSIAVPLKATGGFLLSVLASLGVVVMVFQYGWWADLVNVQRPGAVLSFLPIMVMGVLFGLAMDYEVFLVARMREQWVGSGDAQGALRHGFAASSRVVVAAAAIMVTVFASFVPEGAANVQPIAFALAVGVALDALLVRMTLVPALMALLGERAWRLPAWLDRRLPAVDVEGEGLAAHLEHESWVRANGPAVARVERLSLLDPDTRDFVLRDVTLVVRPGQIAVLTGDAVARRAALAVLAGRLRPDGGTVVVMGRVLPADGAAVRARVCVERDLQGSGVRRDQPLRLLDLDDVTSREAEALTRIAEEGAGVVVAVPAAQVDGFVAALERAGARTGSRLHLPADDRQEVLR